MTVIKIDSFVHNPASAEQWLNQRLGNRYGRAVVQVDAVPEASDRVYRFFLDYLHDAEPHEPDSVIVKLPSLSPVRQAVIVSTGMFARETAYYQHIAALSPLQGPACLYAAMDNGGELILQDWGIYHTGDQEYGYTADEAIAISETILAFHHHWLSKAEDDAFAAIPVVNLLQTVEAVPALVRQGLQSAQQVFPDLVTSTLQRAAQLLAEKTAVIAGMLARPVTLLHGDLRLDNVLLDHHRQVKALLDWQLLSRGHPLVDVAYFLSQSGEGNARNLAEKHVLDLYKQAFVDVPEFNDTFDQCWKAALLWAVIIPLVSCAIDEDMRPDVRPLVASALRRADTALQENDVFVALI